MGRAVESTVRLRPAAQTGKPVVRVFVSYADRDGEVAGRLWELLAEAAAVSRVYEFEFWRFDQAIRVGERWDNRIRDTLAECELGLLAVSNAFLASRYITDVELPALVDVPGKRVIPVALRPTSTYADMHGLDGKQIYGYRRPFSEVRGRSGRDVWVNELVDQIHRVLDRYTGPAAGAR